MSVEYFKRYAVGFSEGAYWGAGVVAASLAATTAKVCAPLYCAIEILGVYGAKSALEGIVSVPLVYLCPKEMQALGIDKTKAWKSLETGIKGLCAARTLLVLAENMNPVIASAVTAAKFFGSAGGFLIAGNTIIDSEHMGMTPAEQTKYRNAIVKAGIGCIVLGGFAPTTSLASAALALTGAVATRVSSAWDARMRS